MSFQNTLDNHAESNYFLTGGPARSAQQLKPTKTDDIQQYGTQCMAYSAHQKGIKEFRHPPYKGFIPYMTVWGVDYVLSDPIAPKEHQLGLTHLFLAEHKNAVFCQISETFARQLNQIGFKVNAFGVENVIDLNQFEVTWKKRKCLKSYLSKLEKQKFFVFEHPPTLKKVMHINERWLKAKAKGKELRFMARPFAGMIEKDVRYFYLYHKNAVLGFCTFDPIYASDQNKGIESYTLQHLRVSDEAPLGSQDYLILNAIEQFKKEGVEKISLGLAPLYKRKNSYEGYSRKAEAVFNGMYKTNLCYNYKTIGQHKDHYKAEQMQTFIASRRSFSWRQLCGMLKVNNLI